MLKNPGAVKGPFTKPPIVSSGNDGLYTIVGMHSGSIVSSLPRDEHYALINDKLVRIKLVGEELSKDQEVG